MSALRKLAGFLIFSNLFVALAVACLTFETQLLLFSRIDVRYTAFVFFSTLFLYNFHRVFRLKKRSAEEQRESRHRWVAERRPLLWIILLIAAAGLLFITMSYITPAMLVALIPIAFIAFGYSIPFIPAGGRLIRLRDIPLAKIFLISLVLCLVTVWLPVVFEHSPTSAWRFSSLMNRDTWILFLRRMLFIFAITIPFDIRDIEHDRQSKVLTIPLLVGERAAKIIAEAALLVFIVLVIVQWQQRSLDDRYAIALIASAVAAGIPVWLSSHHRKEYFYTFLVEGSMIVQTVFVLIAYSTAV